MPQKHTFQDIKSYQGFYKKLVQLEREEEMSRQLGEIKHLRGAERERKGRAILNLSGNDAGTGLGGTFLVRLSIAEGLPDTEISVGDLVILSTGHPSGKESQAVVTEKRKRAITIAYSLPPPPYARQNRLRLDLFANDITFQRMLTAIKALQERPALSDYLLGNEKVRQDPGPNEHECSSGNLNDSQVSAVNKATLSNPLFLIHGPPGTGKTTTLVEVIKELAKQEKKVLATADSNTAVDNMLGKLMAQGCKVVRMGNPARISDDLIGVTLDYQLQDQGDYQHAMSVWDQVHEIKQSQKQYIAPSGQNRRGLKDREIMKLAKQKGSSRGIPAAQIYKMSQWLKLQYKAQELADRAINLEHKAIAQIIDYCDVVCSTNSTAGSDHLQGFTFDYACIDEATQATAPACLIPMTKASRWIMAGDHKQLPPTVISQEAKALQYSLFEAWMEQYGAQASALLTIQYRMHRSIMAFPNAHFYEEQLKAHPSVANHQLSQLAGYHFISSSRPGLSQVIAPGTPVSFYEVQGEEQQLADSFSYFNLQEVEAVTQITEALMACRLFPGDIGVISPYDQQVNQIKKRLADWGIEVKTVDGFQGREKEVIIISLVRANQKGEIGFLTDYRRLNVALTRAKRKLIIVGDPITLKANKLYRQLIDALQEDVGQQ